MAERVGFNNKLLIRNTLGGVPGEATRRVAGPEKIDLYRAQFLRTNKPRLASQSAGENQLPVWCY
jgi:hypothetical protein